MPTGNDFRSSILWYLCPTKSSSFENFWWRHCMWFVVWASLPIKNSGHAYKLEIARKTFLKTFFFGEHLRLCPWSLASSIPVLGLERVCPRKGCPWPRIFFVSLASSLVSSTPPLMISIKLVKAAMVSTSYKIDISFFPSHIELLWLITGLAN